MENLKRINALPAGEAEAEFLKCCGSAKWAKKMAAGRPYADAAALSSAAEKTWYGLRQDEWLEAFASHPVIGDVDSLRAKFSGTRQWATHEQAGVGGANEAILTALAEGNVEYEKKFGYIFIVCATGKSASEMLATLQKRLNNDRQSELIMAAEEQRKIMRLRLEKLLQ